MVIYDPVKVQVVKYKPGSLTGIPHKVFQIPAVLGFCGIDKDQVVDGICLKQRRIGMVDTDPVRQPLFRNISFCLGDHCFIDLQGIDPHIPPYHGHTDCRVTDRSTAFQDIPYLRMILQKTDQELHPGIHHDRYMMPACILYQFFHRMPCTFF